jgi:hypothetical protein
MAHNLAAATYKYVFFYCPGEGCTPFRVERFPRVEIVPLSELQVWGDFPNV